MFGLISKPRPHLIETDGADDLAFEVKYNRVAEKVGAPVRSVLATRMELLGFLRGEHIPVYDLQAVEKYMDRRGYWVWSPWRKKDAKGADGENVRVSRFSRGNGQRGTLAGPIYEQPVPYPVLLTAEKLVDKFSDEIQFFVAHEGKDPDPFLGCLLKGDPDRRPVVIEKWDEPSFRG